MLGLLKNFIHRMRATLAVIYYGYPARKITLIGVTGTDGKTTTVMLLYHLLNSSTVKVAVVSTVEANIAGKKIKTGLHVTSPDSWVLQRLLKQAVYSGCQYIVLEMTSHGLDQHRLLGTNPSIAVLTNITHEHLDYHGTYDRYFRAKMKLLKSAKTILLNKNDRSYRKVKKYLKSNKKIISYDLNSISGSLLDTVKSKFPEDYNRLNATAAVLTARELGVNNSDSITRIKSFPGVVGRMDEIDNRLGIWIIVDFAHTPGALESVLKHLAKGKKKGNRLIAVFGSAGDRDVEKRVLMGKVAGKYSDISVLTAEDPRHEDVGKIIDEIAKGTKKAGAKELKINENFSKSSVFIKIPERGEAITFAIQKLAKKGDIVVICGKGHEQSMSYSGTEYPWSDHDAVRKAIKGETKKIKRK